MSELAWDRPWDEWPQWSDEMERPAPELAELLAHASSPARRTPPAA